MLNDEEIISSFALCDTNAGEDHQVEKHKC